MDKSVNPREPQFPPLQNGELWVVLCADSCTWHHQGRGARRHCARLVLYADAIHLPATPFLYQEFRAIFLKASHISSRAIHKQQHPRVPEGSVWLLEIKFTIEADQILLIMDQGGKREQKLVLKASEPVGVWKLARKEQRAFQIMQCQLCLDKLPQ